MKGDRRPQVVVIGGPNGAGKTSATPELLRDGVGIDTFVNADVIAQGLAGFRPASAAVEAGRIMLGRLDELVRARENFAFESTLSGLSLRRRLLDWLAFGYDIQIVYLWLPSPDMAVARVRRRVEAGGHDVPESVIRRRFWRSLVNFDCVYRQIVTTWRIVDGSSFLGLPVVATGEQNQEPAIIDQTRWNEIRRRIKEHA